MSRKTFRKDFSKRRLQKKKVTGGSAAFFRALRRESDWLLRKIRASADAALCYRHG
jgi:hypothetical protein